jgi:hypothetical protein
MRLRERNRNTDEYQGDQLHGILGSRQRLAVKLRLWIVQLSCDAPLRFAKGDLCALDFLLDKGVRQCTIPTLSLTLPAINAISFPLEASR